MSIRTTCANVCLALVFVVGADRGLAQQPSEMQRSFASLIADGFEIKATTLGPVTAEKPNDTQFMVTLQRQNTVAVCSFAPTNWVYLNDESLAKPSLCDVRTFK